MTRILDIMAQRRSPRLVAALALSAAFALGLSVAPASAQPHRDEHRGNYHQDWHHNDRDYHGGGYHAGGYYPAPPVVYGGPVYAPPPVAYGPAIGITLPGISIGIQ